MLGPDWPRSQYPSASERIVEEDDPLIPVLLRKVVSELIDEPQWRKINVLYTRVGPQRFIARTIVQSEDAPESIFVFTAFTDDGETYRQISACIFDL